MEYRRMGRSGLKVSPLCLGTMTFGQGADEQASRRMVDMALAAGINFFDTADSYAGGESEVLLGRALRGQRDAAVIALDLSATMNAVDVQPSRLERAKQKIRDLLALRSGARTALVAYAGSAHTVLPLSDDPPCSRPSSATSRLPSCRCPARILRRHWPEPTRC